MPFVLAEDHHYLASLGVTSPQMIGIITPVTSDLADAHRFGSKDDAEALLPRLNLSPYANWHVQEVTA